MTTKFPNNAIILKNASLTGIRAHDLSGESEADGSKLGKL